MSTSDNSTQDTHYKALFSHKEMVRDLLQGFVDGDWLNDADFDSLEQVPNDHVTDRSPIAQRHDDVIWRLKVGESWVYLYVLLEFQSNPDRWMALRMLTYTALLWERLVKQNELANDGRLPPVLPLVLYNGEKTWHATQNLKELCYPPPSGLAPYQPSVRYLLLDEQQLIGRAQGMENLAAALFRLEFTRREEMVQLLLELSQWVTHSAPKPLQRSLYRFMVRWVKQKIPEGRFPEEMSAFEESVPMLAARLDQWEKEAIAEGVEKGIEQGIEKGIVQGVDIGLSNMLKRQLTKRFGPLSTDTTALIEQAATSQLEEAALAILDAEALEDVLGHLRG